MAEKIKKCDLLRAELSSQSCQQNNLMQHQHRESMNITFLFDFWTDMDLSKINQKNAIQKC